MKIKRLDLLAFGPFTATTLDLGSPGLHVVFGRNEAGKSSTLRALKAWLFGIPMQTTDAFLHSYAQLRVGGILSFEDGREFAFLRRKAAKHSLLDPLTEQPLDADTLTRLLGGLDEPLFTRLFGIDHTGLVKGGEDILEETGELGKALFGAALGRTGLSKVLGDLGKEASELFRPTASSKLINRKVARLRDLRKEERSSLLSVNRWKELQKVLGEAEAAVTRSDTRIAEVGRRISRLERHHRIAGLLAERRELLERKAELAEVLLLPLDFPEQRRLALESKERIRAQLEKDLARHERWKADLAQLVIPQELLDHRDTIEVLHRGLGAVQKAQTDRPQLDTKRREYRNEAERLLRSIRPELGLEEIEQLRPLLNRGPLVAQLAEDHRSINQALVQLDTSLLTLETEREAQLRELGDLERQEQDPAPLKAALTSARKTGDLSVRLADVRGRVESETIACSRELSRLGRFKGTLEELLVTSFPGPTVLDTYERLFEEQRERKHDLERRRTENEAALNQAHAELGALLRAGEVPSQGDLERARSHRDQGWTLVRTLYVEGGTAGEDMFAFAAGQPLPDAYERSVLSADEVADRLRKDAREVQQRVMLEARIEQAEALRTNLAGEEALAAEAAAHLGSAWTALWQGVTLDIGQPREMKAWLLRVDTLLHRTEALHLTKSEASKLAAEHQSHTAAVVTELARSGCACDGLELEQLLLRAEQLVEDAEKTNRERKATERSLVQLERKLQRAVEDRKQEHDRLDRWKESWSKAVEGLGLGTDPHPTLALSTMKRLEELFGTLDKSDELRRRLYGMEMHEQEYLRSVTDFVARLGLAFDTSSPDVLVRTLDQRSREAQANAASRTKLVQQLHELEEDLADLRIEQRTSDERLHALRFQAHAASDEELELLEQRSHRKRNLDERLEALEHQLRQSGDGLDLETLETESRELDPDRVADELAQLRVDHEVVLRTRDEERDRRRTLLDELSTLDGRSRAAEAAEDAERLVAGLVSDAEHYLRLEFAISILNQEMERYRREHQSPLLRRAGDLFARLTLHSFSGLRDELDDNGKPVLLGLRSDKNEVRVEGMSEGTRDQLFLALRLATLEQRLEHGEPFPFIVDDILVGFDDPRSKACLEILAELAQRTQVLVFTHHQAVATMARELGRGSEVSVHELG